MGFHINLIQSLKKLAENGDEGAIASILQLMYTHPKDINMDASMLLKLQCVLHLSREEVAHQSS